jgi:hypothetical protein
VTPGVDFNVAEPDLTRVRWPGVKEQGGGDRSSRTLKGKKKAKKRPFVLVKFYFDI